NRDMGIDASNLFNMLSGFSKPPYFHLLRNSPNNIRKFINEKIDDEIDAAKNGRPAFIKMKMNSLSDPKIIEKLYEASSFGVKIQLIIRGICCLKNDIPGISENIEVHSIVGRFLEHSRIYYFYNNGNEDIYLSSADMMTRNLNRRVELLFSLIQSDTKKRAIAIYNEMWEDNIKTRVLHGDKFSRIDRRGLIPNNSQESFIQDAEQKNARLKKMKKEALNGQNAFQPMTKHEAGLPFESEEDD
ncbi:RNA degradosome polyphosphate kinase, partial [Ligilactobacillus ruminis]